LKTSNLRKISVGRSILITGDVVPLKNIT
jgi:hypothetical protein